MVSGQPLLRGFEELQAELKQIAQNVSAPKRNAALEAGAKIIQTRAQALAPRRAGASGGTLKNSGIVLGDPMGDFIEVGWSKDAFYGRFLEYGTSKMSPRPHIRPAYEQRKNQVIDIMLKKLKLE